MPSGDRAKYEVLQWLMFQIGGVGPMLGQAHHFRLYAPEKIDYAIDRYTNEVRPIYRVIDKPLSIHKYIAGRELLHRGHCDFPVAAQMGKPGIVLTDCPHLKAWFDIVAARPAMQRGVKLQADRRKSLTGDKERAILFGKSQYEKQ